jgi:DNA gyrase subunit B
MQYAGDRTHVVSFVNTIPTPQGGRHVAAFQAALTKAVKAFGVEKKLIKDEDVRPEDLNLGLTAIVNVTMGHTPQFQGQTKDALNSPEIHGPVFSATYDYLSAYLTKNIPVGRAIVNQAVASAHGRAAAQLARQQVMGRSSGGLDDAGAELTIKKLADIQRKGGRPVVALEETELHLVEGDSAGGAAKQGRDSARHGILALRGKIPNVYELKLAKALENQEIAAILRAIGGVEANGTGATFNVDVMNFGRVVLTTDADVDGAHIRVLLMVMLWKLRPELVRAGRLYCARPPLYRIVPKKGEARYVYSDEERDAAIKTLGGMGRVEKVQRFKGLGEMSAAEIAETLFSPEARANQVRVSVEDVEEVTRTFQLLMGSEVEPRKNWLMQTWSQPA